MKRQWSWEENFEQRDQQVRRFWFRNIMKGQRKIQYGLVVLIKIAHWILIAMASLWRALPGKGNIFQQWNATLAAAWGWETGIRIAVIQWEMMRLWLSWEMAGSHRTGNISALNYSTCWGVWGKEWGTTQSKAHNYWRYFFHPGGLTPEGPGWSQQWKASLACTLLLFTHWRQLCLSPLGHNFVLPLSTNFLSTLSTQYVGPYGRLCSAHTQSPPRQSLSRDSRFWSLGSWWAGHQWSKLCHSLPGLSSVQAEGTAWQKTCTTNF